MANQSIFALLVAVLVTIISAADIPAIRVLQIFDRDVKPNGGWSLAQTDCPKFAPLCGSSWCCPASMTCVLTNTTNIAAACCPGGVDCVSAFETTPACANTNWSLWSTNANSTFSSGYFCCQPNEVGLATGTCVPGREVSAPSQTASLLSIGLTLVQGSTVDSSTSTTTSGMTTTSTSAPTTTTSIPSSSTTSGLVATPTSGAGKTSTGVGAMFATLFVASSFIFTVL